MDFHLCISRDLELDGRRICSRFMDHSDSDYYCNVMRSEGNQIKMSSKQSQPIAVRTKSLYHYNEHAYCILFTNIVVFSIVIKMKDYSMTDSPKSKSDRNKMES